MMMTTKSNRKRRNRGREEGRKVELQEREEGKREIRC
jgi:hypothetical protein